jgi:CheY-like chemotaxis protein
MVTVFVVDDEPGFRHILALILQRAGYQVLQASSAFEALKVIESQPLDLLILDDMMPGMSGSELCLKLKQDVRYCHIPVIMHTANAMFNNSALADSIQADGVLMKPCTPQDILSAIGRFTEAQT